MHNVVAYIYYVAITFDPCFSNDAKKREEGNFGYPDEDEIASIFARSHNNEIGLSFLSTPGPLSAISGATPKEETKLLSQKMKLLLSKGVAGLHKVFPMENKNHQASFICMLRIPWNWNIKQIYYAQNIIANIQRVFSLAHYNNSFTPLISC